MHSARCLFFGLVSACAPRHLPGLRSVAVEDLVGSDQVQFPVPLLEHVDPGEPAGRGDESLLHGGRVHQLPVQNSAAGQKRMELDSSFNPEDGL